MLDVFFLSMGETGSEENWQRLLEFAPNAKRVKDVVGIFNAHRACAIQSTTENFWVVDADAIVVDDFKLDLLLPKYDRDAVYVWKSRNPINSLEYGYGGVKLLPRKLTIDMQTDTTDMTTSISKNFKPINSISNITAFNTDEYSTWRSAFRECVKLCYSIKRIARLNMCARSHARQKKAIARDGLAD